MSSSPLPWIISLIFCCCSFFASAQRFCWFFFFRRSSPFVAFSPQRRRQFLIPCSTWNRQNLILFWDSEVGWHECTDILWTDCSITFPLVRPCMCTCLCVAVYGGNNNKEWRVSPFYVLPLLQKWLLVHESVWGDPDTCSVFYICNWSIKKHVNYSFYLKLSAEAALPAVIVPSLQYKCTFYFALNVSSLCVWVCVCFTQTFLSLQYSSLTSGTLDLRPAATWARWSINRSNSDRCKSHSVAPVT